MAIEKIGISGLSVDETTPKSTALYTGQKIAELTNLATTPLEFLGTAYTTTAEYSSHIPNNGFYDSVLDKVVVFFNEQSQHVNGTGVINYRTIDPQTLEYSAATELCSEENKKFVTSGVVRRSNGDWMVLVRKTPHDSSTIEKYIIYQSTDQGANWTNWDLSYSPSKGTYEDQCCNLYELSSGRLISGMGIATSKTYVIYSDNDGVTWTPTANQIPRHTSYTGATPHEIRFIELPSGRIMGMLRASMNANLFTQVEPVLITFSDDNGETWSTQVASTTLTDCTANYPPSVIVHEDEGLLELVWGSRYIWDGESSGRIYHTIATYEQAENDEFPTPTVIGNYISEVGQDCGYHGSCIDAYGGIHSFYYDLKVATPGECNIKYIYGQRSTVSAKQDISTIKSTYVKKPSIVAVTGNKTLGYTDINTVQKCTASADITVPAGIGLPIGTEIAFVQYGASDTVEFVEDTGVTIYSALGNKKLNGQYATAALFKIAANEWILSGNLKS